MSEQKKEMHGGGIRCDLGFELLLDSGDLLLLNGPFKNRADIFPLPSCNCIRPRTPLQKPIEESLIAMTSHQNALNKYPTGHSSSSWVCPRTTIDPRICDVVKNKTKNNNMMILYDIWESRTRTCSLDDVRKLSSFKDWNPPKGCCERKDSLFTFLLSICWNPPVQFSRSRQCIKYQKHLQNQQLYSPSGQL